MNFSLNTSLKEYLEYHWERTVNARKVITMSEAEFIIIWTKNYYQERCELLEKVGGIYIGRLS
jgi:hypothetical protein